MTVTIRTVVEVGEENRDKGRRTWKQIGGGWDLKRWKWIIMMVMGKNWSMIRRKIINIKEEKEE